MRKDRELVQKLMEFFTEHPDLIQKDLEVIKQNLPLPGVATLDLLCKNKKTGEIILVLIKTKRRSFDVRRGKIQLLKYSTSINRFLEVFGGDKVDIGLVMIAYNGKNTYIFSTKDTWINGDNERMDRVIGKRFHSWLKEKEGAFIISSV